LAVPDDLRPLHTDDDYEAALRQMEVLWGSPSGTPEGDRLDILATLVDAYETARMPMTPPDPITAIQFRMEQLGLRPRDLADLLGTDKVVTEILDRKRGLTLPMIRRLHERLEISADILIQPIV
jgi:HTH-type transcriptional regulator/antitoxin HigA